MPSDLHDDLRRALARPVPPVDEARRDSELDALLTEHARRFPRRPGRVSRWLLGLGLGAAVAVGACVVPVDYEAEVGHRLAFVIDSREMTEIDVESMARFIEIEHAPDELRIAARAEMMKTDAGETHDIRIELAAVGEHLDADALWDDLVAEFPALAEARREDVALQGTVHGTLGGRLSHEWLDVTIDRHGVDEAKRRIIEQLAAQGVEGTPDVQIIDEDLGDGHRRREIRVHLEE
jgi:hypothetical protein